jgi:hypothetical protein
MTFILLPAAGVCLYLGFAGLDLMALWVVFSSALALGHAPAKDDEHT